MDNFVRYLYVKFRIEKHLNMMNALFISEDKDRIEKWQAQEESKDRSEADLAQPDVKNSFEVISNTFEASIDEFQSTVPFIMQMVPLLLQIADDRSIRQFVQRQGEALEKGDFETYRIGIDHIGEINKRLARATTIRKGVESLPSMFF